MEYNQFSFEDQVIKNRQLADACSSILGMSVYTSVVNPRQEMISIVTDIRKMQQKFSCIGGHSPKAFVLISFWKKHCRTV